MSKMVRQPSSRSISKVGREEPLIISAAPLPDAVLKMIVGDVVTLAVIGAVHAVRIQPRMFAVVGFVAGFIAYRTIVRVNPYFMWYLPPFTALLFLLAAFGVSWIAMRLRPIAVAASFALVLAYATPLPYTLQLDKRMQEGIEVAVRSKTGKILNGMMSPNDTVALGPLGFIGWEAKNKTTYDFPGLASPKAFAAYRKHHHMTGLITELSPTFLVFRPAEWKEFNERAPALVAKYRAVAQVQADPSLSLSVGGAAYYLMDNDFIIYRRQ